MDEKKEKAYAKFGRLIELRNNLHENPFLESGCRCEVCDEWGTKDIPITGRFICDKCKSDKNAKIILERKRLEGLISMWAYEVTKKHEEYNTLLKQLEHFSKQLKELEQKEEIARKSL